MNDYTEVLEAGYRVYLKRKIRQEHLNISNDTPTELLEELAHDYRNPINVIEGVL
jgi:signal transduction histidine kinase